MEDWNFFPDKSKKIAIGLSGGVDSSVAAARLVRMGYEVIGFWMWLGDIGLLRSPTKRAEVNTNFYSVFESQGEKSQGRSSPHWRLLIYENPHKNCISPRALTNLLPPRESVMAAKICQFLKIPFYVIDLRKEFKKEVIEYFLNEYKNGRTPNPCVVCNQKIKFGQMLEIATKKLKANYLATGHYVRIFLDKSGFFRLLNGVDKKKDQSYFLYTLNQKKIDKTVFPNGSYFKKETRKIAKKWQLPTKDVAESENICFIKNFNKRSTYRDNFQNFLNRNLKPKSGLVIDNRGNVLGTHRGLCFYTIGSRGGWEFELKAKTSKPKAHKDKPRLYVIKKDNKKNQLIVGTRDKASKKEFMLKEVNWIGNDSMVRWFSGSRNCLLKVRSMGKFLKAKLKKVENKKIKVILEKPELGIAPGQSAVFYEKLSLTSSQPTCQILGGGVIKQGG